MPERALAEGAVAGDLVPATATFHQADCVPRDPVEAADGPGVTLETLHLHGRVTVGLTGLRKSLVMAVMTATKENITNQVFYISKDWKMDSTSFLDQYLLPYLLALFTLVLLALRTIRSAYAARQLRSTTK